MNTTRKLLFAVTTALTGFALSAPAAVVIYQDDFNGSGAGTLNGTAPDVAPGAETWIASGLWNDAGAKPSPNHGSAFLPFTPVALKTEVYQLSMDVNPDAINNPNWMSLGFTGTTNTGNWLANDIYAWMLNRMNDGVQTFRGPGTSNGATHASSDPGWVNLMVQLNTRNANWSVEWYLDGQLIRNTLNSFATNPTITHVGFSGYDTTTGVVDNFLLQRVEAPLPEPSTAIFAMFGFFLLRGLRTKQDDYC